MPNCDLQSGEGWKAGVGGTLIGLGTIGAAGNLGGDKALEGLIGGAILSGIGGLLIHADKKKQKGKGFDREFLKAVKSGINKVKAGGAMERKIVDDKVIKTLVQKYKDSPIHVKDILGKDWKKHAQVLVKQIRAQSGSGFGKDVKKKFIDFLQGKTKFKPSTLMDVAAGAVGIAGAASAFIPGVDLISVPAASAAALGLKSGAHLLKTSGRGYYTGQEEQGGGMSEQALEIAYRLGDAALIAATLGIGVAAARALLKKAKKMKGSGLKLAGQGVSLAGSGKRVPKKLREFIENYKSDAEKVIVYVKDGKSIGSGRSSKLSKALGLAVSVAPTAYKLYKFLKENPELLEQVMSMIKTGASYVMGGTGSHPAGISFTPSGKVKRDRYSVYYGYHKKTAGGLTKDDLVLRGKKVMSKKKIEQGRRALQYLKK